MSFVFHPITIRGSICVYTFRSEDAAMFAPPVAKAQTRAAESPTSKLPQRSTVVARPFGGGAVERAHTLQRAIGNQATLWLLSQRTSSLTGNEPGGDHEREGTPEIMTAPEPPRGVSWDFSKIPIFQPDRPNGHQAGPPLTAPPSSSVLQPKLVVGEVNDPLEHEADRVADQVMRMPDPRVSARPDGRSTKVLAPSSNRASVATCPRCACTATPVPRSQRRRLER
jgi:hypothetical protein